MSNVVFLLDVDNTLLNNDQFTDDLRAHLTAAFGQDRQERYWTIFESLRKELGYADYLGALQKYRSENSYDCHFLQLSYFFLEYPFAKLLYPQALTVIGHLNAFGQSVILSDGDVVFQPLKIKRSGLLDAVEGHSLVYIHKELALDDVAARYPTSHYVLVDDKLRILTAFKQAWGSKVTTVFPRQGHYTLDPEILATYPPADITIERISDLLSFSPAKLVDVTTRAAERKREQSS
jgi:FMN phosphatase YigB (HAD superfamily)